MNCVRRVIGNALPCVNFYCKCAHYPVKSIVIIPNFKRGIFQALRICSGYAVVDLLHNADGWQTL